MAKEQRLDLVEISPNATPPVCRITDYGKYAYEQKKLRKEQKKSTTTIKIKEIQLRPNIDPHDFTFKLNHAIDFLCEDMKVKVILRFRGKELRTSAAWVHESAPLWLRELGALGQWSGLELDAWSETLVRCARKAGRAVEEMRVLTPEADFPSPDGRHPLKMVLVTLD